VHREIKNAGTCGGCSLSSAEQLGVSLFDPPLALFLARDLAPAGEIQIQPRPDRVHRPLPRVPVVGAIHAADRGVAVKGLAAVLVVAVDPVPAEREAGGAL
jgi:hypothetical protein